MSGEITVTCDSESSQPPRKLRAVRMRHLVADMHRQVLAALVPHGAAAARLDRRVGLAVLMEFGLDHDRRFGEAALRIARREATDARSGSTASVSSTSAAPGASAPSMPVTGASGS